MVDEADASGLLASLVHATAALRAMTIQIGVVAPSPGSLSDRLRAALEQQGAHFLVAPLVHPRYRRDARSTVPERAEPFTRSDTVLHSGQWGSQIVGMLSPWLRLDAAAEPTRRRSEAAFLQEIAWASHLTISTLLLPPPGLDCLNYARHVNQAALSAPHLQLLVRVPLCAPAAEG